MPTLTAASLSPGRPASRPDEADGSEFTVVQEKLTTPAIAHAGKQVMAYDVGGYALHVIRAGKGSVLDVTAEQPILDADLAEDGSVLLFDERERL